MSPMTKDETKVAIEQLINEMTKGPVTYIPVHKLHQLHDLIKPFLDYQEEENTHEDPVTPYPFRTVLPSTNKRRIGYGKNSK